MLEIKPINDKKEQEKISLACGMKYRPELFAYKAFEGGELLASAHFDIEGRTATVYGMKQVIGSKDDLEAMFILGRAVLNFLDLCGVETAYFDLSEEGNGRMARLLGFRREDGKMSISLKGLFTSPCDHGKGKK